MSCSQPSPLLPDATPSPVAAGEKGPVQAPSGASCCCGRSCCAACRLCRPHVAPAAPARRCAGSGLPFQTACARLHAPAKSPAAGVLPPAPAVSRWASCRTSKLQNVPASLPDACRLQVPSALLGPAAWGPWSACPPPECSTQARLPGHSRFGGPSCSQAFLAPHQGAPAGADAAPATVKACGNGARALGAERPRVGSSGGAGGGGRRRARCAPLWLLQLRCCPAPMRSF